MINKFLWRIKKLTRDVAHTVIRTIFGPDILYRSKFAGIIDHWLSSVQVLVSPARRREARFQREHPDVPWFAQESIPYIESLLKPDFIGFEWGCGRSTIWFAKKISHLTSVEGRKSWFENVKKMLKEQNLEKKADLHLAEITSEYEFDKKEIERYASHIDSFGDKTLDIIIVDGHVRVLCLHHALSKIKPGGILILDNADLAEFKPLHFSLKNVESKTFSNGIWETSVFICPKDGFPQLNSK